MQSAQARLQMDVAAAEPLMDAVRRQCRSSLAPAATRRRRARANVSVPEVGRDDMRGAVSAATAFMFAVELV
jgi:hypothetical protein